jgi:hypothetical protein
MTRCAHVLLSNTAPNTSPLHAQYEPCYLWHEECACVTLERMSPRRMFFDRRIPALPSYCINQAVTSRTKITTMECRCQVN